MTTIGKIVKISENKYVWTVTGTGYSPYFLIKSYQTRLYLSKINSPQTGYFNIWEVKVDLDSKLSVTTGVKITLKISLESDILLCTNSILSSAANITLNQRAFIPKSFAKDLINVSSPIQIECDFFNLSVRPLTQIMPSQPTLATVLDEKRKEFQELFNSGKFSDLTIVSRGVELQAHKNILSARSKVFAAMLKDGTKESKESKIEIDDIDGDIMKEVLNFIYTGEVTDIDKLAYDLVAPADKYEIRRLLALCEETLVKNISLENLKPILTLINLYDVSLLKKKTFEFLQNNSAVIKQKDFTDFLQKLSPLILTEIIVLFSSKAS